MKAAKGLAWSLDCRNALRQPRDGIAACKSTDPKRLRVNLKRRSGLPCRNPLQKQRTGSAFKAQAPGDCNPRRCHNWLEYLELGGEPCGYRGFHYTPRVDGTANAIAVVALNQ